MVQAGGGVMVWGIFSWHALGPLVPIEHRLNATAYLSIVADHVHPFMTTVYHLLMATSSRIMHLHKAQIISDWFLEHDNEFTLLKWPPQSPDLNPIEHLWDVVEREIHIMDVQPTNLQQLCDAIMSIWTKIQKRNVYNTFLNICQEELRQFWRQRGVQPGTSKVCLIKWPVSVCHIIYMGIYQYAVFLLTYLQLINFQICNLSNNISQIPSFFDSNCKLTCGDFTYFGPYGAKAPKIIYILLDWWLRVQIYGALL